MTAATGRIDSHHHLWDLAVRDQDWIPPEMSALRRSFSTDDLLAATDGTGVSRSVVVQCETSMDETVGLLAIAAGSDAISGVVGWVDLTSEHVADDIARLQGGTGGRWLRAIRHIVQAEPDPEWLCRPDVRRGLLAVHEAGLSYDLLTYPHQLRAATATVRDLPQIQFVMDHCSKPYIAKGEMEPWATEIGVLGRLPNVVCKLSGVVTEADWHAWSVADLAPYVETVFGAFGDRVMFGSDWPMCLVATTYADWVGAVEELTAALSPDERESLWTGAATRAYRLDAVE